MLNEKSYLDVSSQAGKGHLVIEDLAELGEGFDQVAVGRLLVETAHVDDPALNR